MKAVRYNIIQFHKEYPNNAACLDRLFRMRYPNPKCPSCGRVNAYHRHGDRSSYVCNCGKHEISPKQGTIFQKSDTDLVKWFHAMFLMSQSRNGVAALELQRQVGVTYKTAWRMQKMIRTTMQDAPTLQSGEVEADETYIGGHRSGTRGRGAKSKTVVFGTLQRKGKLNTAIVPNVKAKTLAPHIMDNVAKGTDLITDELQSYKKIATILALITAPSNTERISTRSQTGLIRILSRGSGHN